MAGRVAALKVPQVHPEMPNEMSIQGTLRTTVARSPQCCVTVLHVSDTGAPADGTVSRRSPGKKQ